MIGHFLEACHYFSSRKNQSSSMDGPGGEIHGWIEEVTFIKLKRIRKSCSSLKAALCSAKATCRGYEAESAVSDKKCIFFSFFSALITSGPKSPQVLTKNNFYLALTVRKSLSIFIASSVSLSGAKKNIINPRTSVKT